MAHLRLNISGMTDPTCQARIERALLQLPGMWSAVICLDQGYADIEYADDVGPSPDEVVEAVRGAGYGARIGG